MEGWRFVDGVVYKIYNGWARFLFFVNIVYPPPAKINKLLYTFVV